MYDKLDELAISQCDHWCMHTAQAARCYIFPRLAQSSPTEWLNHTKNHTTGNAMAMYNLAARLQSHLISLRNHCYIFANFSQIPSSISQQSTF